MIGRPACSQRAVRSGTAGDELQAGCRIPCLIFSKAPFPALAPSISGLISRGGSPGEEKNTRRQVLFSTEPIYDVLASTKPDPCCC